MDHNIMALVTMDSAQNSYVAASDLDLRIPCYCEENALEKMLYPGYLGSP